MVCVFSFSKASKRPLSILAATQLCIVAYVYVCFSFSPGVSQIRFYIAPQNVYIFF